MHISFMDTFYFGIRRSNQDGGSTSCADKLPRMVTLIDRMYFQGPELALAALRMRGLLVVHR
jgi:hypothetical protein